MELVLQLLDGTGKLFKFRIGNHADIAVFESDGVAGMHAGADAVEAKDFAGHLEARDLLAPVFEQDIRLERAGTDGVDGHEWVVAAVQWLLALDFTLRTDQVIQPEEIRFADTEGQAQLKEVALGTSFFKSCECNGCCSLHLIAILPVGDDSQTVFIIGRIDFHQLRNNNFLPS